MLFFGQQGFQVVAHDRRGHGRSDQTWDNNTMDQFADDLGDLLDYLDLKEIILVGHSTGGGEVARYIARHSTRRIAKLVLVSAVPPLMLKTKSNPRGLELKVFDEMRALTAENRAQYFRELSLPFYGFNRSGSKTLEGLCDSFWLQGMMGGIKAHYDSIQAFSETDFSDDLREIDVPTLIIHGDDDQIVPIGSSALQSSRLVPGAQLKIYKGAPHGLAQTHLDLFNNDLLNFIRGTEMESRLAG